MEKDKRLEATARLLEVMNTLREKCPWDRVQTFDTLRNATIEETYELVDAITDHNMEGVKEEIGDLLLHVIFYSKLGEEVGAFDYTSVVNALCDKLIYRHPHVYGDIHADTPAEVKQNWEALKLRKKNRKSGTLEGVPRSLPATVKAYRIGEKAAGAGFDWQKREDVWAKVREEIAEVDVEIEAKNHDRLEGEFGDLFFAMINACRLYGIDPEAALERTNKKFIRRFGYMEQCAVAGGHTLSEMQLEEMEALWQESKKDEQ
ncbi:MAG: nucleoside triphosphate pyrophosphohydrolase [Alistipes sp.]